MGRVVLIACTNVGRHIIEAIKTSDCLRDVDLVGVINLHPSVSISKANYDSYIDLVEKYDLPIYYCKNVNEKSCVDFIKQCSPDIILQSGWSQKFGDELLQTPKYACIGEHPAPLPKGRGAACINWAILTGETDWGDTFFHMEKQYDTGEIYSQVKFRIELYDDVKTVYDKVAAAAVSAIEHYLPKWSEGILEGWIQDSSSSTHYPRRKPSDGLFDFGQSALSVYNQIRAQTKPYPGAFFMYKQDSLEKKIYVWSAKLGESPADGGIQVTCGDGNKITLLRVQVDGHPESWAADCPYLGELK